MNIAALKVELLAGHPDTGAYDADAVLAMDELNLVNRTTNRTSMTGSEVANAVVPSEFAALDATEQVEFWNVVHLGDLNPFGIEATLLTNIFGGGSDTIIALNALRKNNVSRAVEIGLGIIKHGHVLEARK